MGYQVTPFLILNFLIAVISISLGCYAAVRYSREQRRSTVLAFAVLMFSIGLWEVGKIYRSVVVPADLKLAGINFMNAVTLPLIVYSLLWFALAYAEHNRSMGRWLAGLAVGHIFGVSLLVILRPEFFYEAIGFSTQGPISILGLTVEQYVVLDRDLHFSFVVYQLYAYAVSLVAAGIIVRYVIENRSDLHVGQGSALLVGIGAPLLTNGLLFAGIVPAEMNQTSLAFGVTGLAFAVAIFRYRMFRIVPVGREEVIEIMSDPFVVLDDDGRVADCNPAARNMVDIDTGWRGMHAEEFFAPYPAQVERFRDEYDVMEEICVTRNGTEKFFDLNTSSIRMPNGTLKGRVIVLRDITQRSKHKRQLERQNERLDRFSSLVSHDLRNPLTVLQGRVKLLEPDERNKEHVKKIERAAERMDDIIGDMLALSRAGHTVADPEVVSLGSVVADSWVTVSGHGLEFDDRVPDSATVEADRDRLQSVFENLFRNVRDHNDPPVTVRVGTVSDQTKDEADGSLDGFYVEDDGDGIPKDERDAIFDHGYTTKADGTGFGLSIVQEIVEVHDWDITITSGQDGGARFEISTNSPSRTS